MKGNCTPRFVRCFKASQAPCCRLVAPYYFPWTKRTPSRVQSRGSGAELSSGAPSSSCRRLAKKLRATLGGWDADCPACANQRRAFGPPAAGRLGRGVKRMNAYGSTGLFGMLVATSLVSGATGMEINQQRAPSTANGPAFTMPAFLDGARLPDLQDAWRAHFSGQGDAAVVQPASEMATLGIRCGPATCYARGADEQRRRGGSLARRGAEQPFRCRARSRPPGCGRSRGRRSDGNSLDQRGCRMLPNRASP